MNGHSKEHISNLKNSHEYKRYIHDCFEGTRGVPGFFWILLASMSGNEGERTKDTIQFTKGYCDFIREFSAYLLYQFPDLDVLPVEKKLINDMLERSRINKIREQRDRLDNRICPFIE